MQIIELPFSASESVAQVFCTPFDEVTVLPGKSYQGGTSLDQCQVSAR